MLEKLTLVTLIILSSVDVAKLTLVNIVSARTGGLMVENNDFFLILIFLMKPNCTQNSKVTLFLMKQVT